MTVLEKFKTLDSDTKVAYLIALAKVLLPKLKCVDGFEKAEKAISDCFNWLIKRNINAFDLHLQLENMDETSILTYCTLEEDPIKQSVWNCIANTLAYTIKEAYQYENAKYLPQTIECVDEDTIIELLDNFEKATDTPPNFASDFLDKLDWSLNELVGVVWQYDRRDSK